MTVSQTFQKHTMLLAVLAVVAIGTAIFYFRVDALLTTAVMSATLRHSTPILLGALCGLVGERSGIINIGIEGQMLMSAFAGFYVATTFDNKLVGLSLGVVAGVACGMLLGSFLAWMSITLKTDQIIAGTIINILAVGITSFFFQSGRNLSYGKIPTVNFGSFLKEDIPFFSKVLFSSGPITYLALVLLVLLGVSLFHSRWGLRTRAVGEHPSALDTVGGSVLARRYVNLTLAGGIAGLAGVYLSLESVGAFERNMTTGRGFLALAVMIFGCWTPLGAWGGALLFGFALALQSQWSGELCIPLPATNYEFCLPTIPTQFVGMLPYLVTIVVLAGFVGRSRAPAAIGVPYEPGK